MSDEPRERKIAITSIYGRANRRPLVNIEMPDGLDRLSMSPAEARDLGMNLLLVAEACIGDGFVMDFFTKEMGLSDQQAAPLLLKFRGYRLKNEAAGT